jgi:geranylgeranyl diphosphate synthase type II
VGGNIRNAIITATALELVHNAFLVKDDIVDGSEFRRGNLTLNRIYGDELAINAGDALKIIALSALLDNLQILGVRKTLQIMLEFLKMARFSVHGQMMELNWIRNREVDLTQRDYTNMCIRKTCWYTCITPLRCGLIIGSDYATEEQLESVTKLGSHMGLGFQIRDDLLNLMSTFEKYGKEINGDIREGKRTAILIHTLSSCSKKDKMKIVKILAKTRSKKAHAEVMYIRKLMDNCGSLEFATAISRKHAREARRILDSECKWITNIAWKAHLSQLCDFLIQRDR